MNEVILERRRHTGDAGPAAPSTAFPANIEAVRPSGLDDLVLLERRRRGTVVQVATATITVTGIANELEARTGGGVITITLTVATLPAAGSAFNAIRQDLIDGLEGALDTATAWDGAMRPAIAVTAVTRLSAAAASIVLPAVPAFSLPAGVNELVTVTVPASALSTGVPLAAGVFSVASSVALGMRTPRIYLHTGNGQRVRQLRGAV